MTAQPARVAQNPGMLGSEERAIARSVLYAALFDYPLTLAQLRQTLIESAQTPTEILGAYRRSSALQAVVDCRDGFFFPRGRPDLVDERRRREARSRAFLRRHCMLLMVVSWLPYVRMVALSGSIAHLNLEGDGDLDLFIVTRGRRVWSVTVAVVVLAKLLRRRRTVCANFVVADSHLALEQGDLFTASQIVHLRPIVGRDVFLQFVAANPFVGRFYPNFHPSQTATIPRRSWDPASAGLGSWDPASAGLIGPLLRFLKQVSERLFAFPSLAVEAFCRRVYRAYLKRQASSWRSPEQVRLEDDVLKLHTRSHRQSVMERFEEAVRSTLRT